VQPETVRALIEAFRREGQPAWPWHAGQPGHPRLLPRAHWPTLLDLSGDEGARHRLDWSRATRVDVPDRGILIDIDTPGDLGG
jgi:molybdenum cofactor cytidylyltransferase